MENEVQNGLEVPAGFSDLWVEGVADGPDVNTERDREKLAAALNIADNIAEKAGTIVHEAFDKEMKRRGRPGLRGVPADDMGKLTALCIPDRWKEKSPAGILLTVWTYILTDNFVISEPEKVEPEKEKGE